MGKLPVISSEEFIKAVERVGWRVNRRKNSHITLVKPGSFTILAVPARKELPRGTLRTLIRNASLTVEEFVELL